MFEGVNPIAAQESAPGKDGLRRVGWVELAAAINLSRAMRRGENGLLARAGPSFGQTAAKDERGINPSSLASRKAPGDRDRLSVAHTPRRHRENR